MKRLLLYLSLLIISGCQAVSQTMPQPTQTSTGCPKETKAALTNPEAISLNSQTVSKSGQVSADKSVGYTFEAQAGQKLSYQTNDGICIWVYTPDNQLLNTGKIPQTGKYTFQISVPKGYTGYNVKIGLNTPQSSLFSDTSYRPPVDDFIRKHYLNINNRHYKDTWSKLSPRFQSISGSYSEYVRWWDSVSEIKIGEITPIAQSSDFAIVDAELWYVMNNGRVFQDSKKHIYLIWSNESNTWLFNRKSST